MKKFLGTLLALASSIAFGATSLPVQLLNPAGSSSGQAIVSTGASSAPAWGGVGVNGIAAIAANTVLANATGSSASPTAFAMPSCTTALEWVSGTGFVCNSAGAFTTLSASGLISPTSTIGIKGTTTNDSPAAGSIGEAPTNSTSGVSMSNNTAANCTSVSLTAGDWDVWGVVSFAPNASTTVAQIVAGISTTSVTLPATGSFNSLIATLTTGANQAFASPVVIVKLASSGTAYLIGQAQFGGSTMTCTGNIFARRRR